MKGYITRAEWGAKPPTGSMYSTPITSRTEFFVHYDGEFPIVLPKHADCYTHVRNTQAFHQGPQRRWSDLGYNDLVCPHGYVFEGRGRDYVGAHCPDHNRLGLGVQFMLGGDQEPTADAKAAMRSLYDLRCKQAGRTLTKNGHRDGYATLCPGDKTYAWVRAGMPAAALTLLEDIMSTAAEREAFAKEVAVAVMSYATDAAGKSMWKHLVTLPQQAALAVMSYPSAVDGQTMWRRLNNAATDAAKESTVSAEEIAAAIPDTLAQQVVDALSTRLSTPKE